MDFPPEIIKTVLQHLTVDDLKRCLLVSEDIRELIIKTPELMRKFDVILFHDTWKDKLNFIKKYGYFIRSLKFQDVGFDNDDQYKRILKETPNLERLSFIDCYIITPEEPESSDNENQEQNQAENDQNQAENDQNQAENDQNQENNDEQAENPPVEEPNENPQENNEVQEPQNVEVMEVQENQEPENMQIDQNDEVVAQTTNDPKEIEELPPVDTEIHLNSLTYLLLESSSIAECLLKYIQSCNKLKYFKLTFYYQEPKTEFTNFVCQQDNLEELNLQGYSDMVFKSLFHTDITEVAKFKLKKLSLECEWCYHRNFSNFFRAQSQYIKELIISCYNIDFHFYRVIFNNFKKLERLVLPTDWTLNDTRIRIIENCRIESVKDLELVGSNDDLEVFNTFINIFPNVEQLKCENLANFSLQGILENFHSLSRITVDNFRCDTMLFVKMPNLKKIYMDYLCASGHYFFWERLTLDCPNIEELDIEEIGNVKLHASIRNEFRIIIQNLKNWKNLRRCSITCSPHDNSLNPDEDANENERNVDEHPVYKVEINTNAKTIKLSSHFHNRCNDEVEMLREIFKECDISEL